MVGAVATYWTSKKAHERESKRQEHERAAQKERQQSTLLREAAIRFVATMTDISVASDGLTQLSHEWGEVAEQLANARTEQERRSRSQDGAARAQHRITIYEPEDWADRIRPYFDDNPRGPYRVIQPISV